MIKKEFNMLIEGDYVKYIGKGPNNGKIGWVLNIHATSIDVWMSKCEFISVINGEEISDCAAHGQTYKHWKFLKHRALY